MNQCENLILAPDQLIQLLTIFYLPETQNREEIDSILSKWIKSPTSIPTSFEIIRSSDNEKLRFIAACSIHYFILQDVSIFSSLNLTEMFNLFITFIMNNQHRINFPDTKYILISLADLCGIFTNFIETAIKTLPPEIFLILISLLTEEITNPQFDKYNRNFQTNKILQNYIQNIYSFFSNTNFNTNWSQSFSKIFDFYKKPIFCLPFLDKIAMMTQNEVYFQSFISIFMQAFSLHFDDDEETFLFMTNITKIAVSFSINQPDYAADIWATIFDYSHAFLLSMNRVEFSESLFQSFFANIPSFYSENESFCSCLVNFTNIISSANDDVEFYPDELRLKHILNFVGLLILLYDQKSSQKVGEFIEKAVGRLGKTRFAPFVKQFIISRTLTPGSLLVFESKLFTDSDSQIFIQILNHIFTFSEAPIESLSFIKNKLVNTSIVVPVIKQVVQFCMRNIEKHADISIEVLKELSDHHSTEIVPFSSHLSASLLPLVPHLNLTNQQLLIQFFFNILTSNDKQALFQIKEQILQNCRSAIQSSNLTHVKNVIVFLSNLYSDFSHIHDPFIIEFMTTLFPSIFHELSTVVMLPDFELQESLSSLITNASAKCIVFPQIEDQQQRQKVLIEGGMYNEIFQWLFTMMNQFLCDLHFSVLIAFQIRPCNEILKIISHIGPNDNAQIIEEMLDYINNCFSGNSDELWLLIPPQFFIVFLDSTQIDVASLILHFFRMLKINSDEVKSMILQAIITKTTDNQWYSNNALLFDSIKTVAVFINQNKSVFDLYVQMMNSFFPKIIPDNYYFRELWRLSQERLDVIEGMQFSPRSYNIKGELQELIIMNQ